MQLFLRDEVRNKVPILIILFPLLNVKFLLNNSLFLKEFVLIKENIIINMGTLFLTSSLKEIRVIRTIRHNSCKKYLFNV
jgi:hypothetical protein